jgi:DNA-binding beta-propeller fold protein YncE
MTISNSPTPALPEAAAPLPAGDGGGTGQTAPTKMSSKRKKQLAALLAALVILALLFVWYLMNRKPLSELPGLSEAKAPHYEFSIYGATSPLAVAVSPNGDRIYVSEPGGKALVHVYNQAGKQVGTLQPPSSAVAHTPDYIAIDPVNQDVYVSDRMTAKVYIYDAAGTYLRTFAPKGNLGAGWAPLGLAFGPNGSLYATDVRAKVNHRVLEFGPDGVLVRSMGLANKLSFPNGIVVDPSGNVEVADSNNGRLVVFNPAGKMIATIGSGIGDGDLGLPRGVAIDNGGRLYVVDSSDQMVKIYALGTSKAPTPTYIASFGDQGQSDGLFAFPNGVATDTHAHIYVTDQDNNRVQVWGY